MPYDWERHIEPYNYEPVTQAKSGFWGSLWDTTKTATSQVFESGVDLYKQHIDLSYPENKTALVYREPQRLLPPSPDYAMSTPYQRDTLSNKPSTILTSKPFGLSTPLIIGIALIGMFFLMKK